MKERAASRLAWATFGFAGLCLVGGLVLSVLNATGPNPSDWGEVIGADLLWLALFSFPAAGVLVASRQPRNPIGWILLAIGLVWQLGGALGESYIRYGLVTAPGSLPRPDLVSALTSSAWVPGVGLIGTFLIMLFPDGRLPSPRWRWLAWFSGVVLVSLTLLLPFLPGSLADIKDYLPDVPNPLGIEALRPVLTWVFVLVLAVPLCIVGSALSLVARFRRSRGQERLQMKWLAAGAGATAGIYLVTMVLSLFFGGEIWSGSGRHVWLTVLQNASIFSFLLIPLAVGIAILKHRLYDIDIIINRALVYGLLSAILGGTYVLIVTLAGIVLRGSDVVTAAATLAMAALFRPLRRSIQGFIDKRFYRRKYDVARTMEAFSLSIRNEVDLEAMQRQLLAAVQETMQLSHASLWLRE